MAKHQRARLTHERVLDAAAFEFAARGYAQANLQSVAERTGMTKGALYGHFSSKAELAAVVCDRATAEVMEWAAEASTATPEMALDALLHTLLTQVGSNFRLRAALRLALDRPSDRGSEEGGFLAPVRCRLAELAAPAGPADAPGSDPMRMASLALALLFGLYCVSLSTTPGPEEAAALAGSLAGALAVPNRP